MPSASTDQRRGAELTSTQSFHSALRTRKGPKEVLAIIADARAPPSR